MTKYNWDQVIQHGAYACEFDWFAIDKIGNIAMFSAVMDAPVPAQVLKSYETYTELLSLFTSLPQSTAYTLTTKETGDFSDWTNYAEKGLFAFDFQDVHRKPPKNQYDLIAKPVVPLKAEMSAHLVDALVKLDCNFTNGDIPIKLIP